MFCRNLARIVCCRIVASELLVELPVEHEMSVLQEGLLQSALSTSLTRLKRVCANTFLWPIMSTLLPVQPFKHIPKRVKIDFVYFIVLWLNTFPVRTGILLKYLPQELLVRWRLDYKKHCRVLPGTYCEAHNEPVPSNSTEPQTHETIALGPTVNLQGSVKFYCLNTGPVLKRRLFTPIPMPDCIIKQVNAIRQHEGQGHEFRFLNRQCEPFTWTNKVPEDNPKFQGLLENKDEVAIYPNFLAELPGVTLEDEGDPTHAVIEEEELYF
jgi:hypothetical protein